MRRESRRGKSAPGPIRWTRRNRGVTIQQLGNTPLNSEDFLMWKVVQGALAAGLLTMMTAAPVAAQVPFNAPPVTSYYVPPPPNGCTCRRPSGRRTTTACRCTTIRFRRRRSRTLLLRGDRRARSCGNRLVRPDRRSHAVLHRALLTRFIHDRSAAALQTPASGSVGLPRRPTGRLRPAQSSALSSSVLAPARHGPRAPSGLKGQFRRQPQLRARYANRSPGAPASRKRSSAIRQLQPGQQPTGNR